LQFKKFLLASPIDLLEKNALPVIDPRIPDQAVSAASSKISCPKSMASTPRPRQCPALGFQLGVTSR
jgi:hypothetical protein